MLYINKLKQILPGPVQSLLKPIVRFFRTTLNHARDTSNMIVCRIDRVLHKQIIPDNDGDIFVNLGCGTTNHPKFINIDSYPYRHVHYVHGIDLLPMFADASVDLIYASHCLEHFKYSAIESVLREWVRVLRPGGTIRLSVPDFDRLIEIYAATGNPDDIVEQIMGGQDNRYNYHYALFNKLNLSGLLEKVGCVEVEEWTPGKDELSSFDDFSVYHKDISGDSYAVSLNIQAKRSMGD